MADSDDLERVEALARFQSYCEREQHRVNLMIERDRRDRLQESIITAAELSVSEGVTASIVDTKREPTPEWLSHGDVEPFVPRQHDKTVAVVSTVRRNRIGIPTRMAKRGQLSEDQLKGCLWYSMTYDLAGLDPSIPSVQIGREVFGGQNDRVPFTDRQQEAQSDLRLVKKKLPAKYIRFFEAVVIGNIPISRAKRLGQFGRAKALRCFTGMAETVYGETKNFKGVA